MLAFMPEDEIDRILTRSNLKQLTPHTVVDRRELEKQLENVRERGYSLNDQEVAIGVRGIAAPVMSANGRPIAAVNVSMTATLAS